MNFNTNCFDITHKLKKLRKIKRNFDNSYMNTNDFSKSDHLREKLRLELNNSYESILPSKEKILRENEDFYHWIGANFNFEQENAEGHVVWPSLEQRVEAAKYGFDQYLVIPYTRSSSVSMSIRDKLKRLDPEAIIDIDTLQIGEENVRKMINKRRFDNDSMNYVIMIPDPKTVDYHQSHNKSFSQHLLLLKKFQQEYPKLNLKGMKYFEYLIFAMYCLKKYPKKAREYCDNFLLGEYEIQDGVKAQITASKKIKIDLAKDHIRQTCAYYIVAPKEEK